MFNLECKAVVFILVRLNTKCYVFTINRKDNVYWTLHCGTQTAGVLQNMCDANHHFRSEELCMEWKNLVILLLHMLETNTVVLSQADI